MPSFDLAPTESPPPGRIPSMTVAVPTCNGARHLREALASIRAQEGVSFDLIVSDDRSDDDTLGIIAGQFGDRARVSVNPERLGLAGNWNRCVELSRSEWVAIFHQDDVMHPGHLSGHQRAIHSEASSEARIGLIAGPVEMIDESGRPVSPRVVDPGGLPLRMRSSRGERPTEIVSPPGKWLTLMSESNPLRCSAVTIRKSAHEAVGGFDPSYRYAVDWDFWLRLAREWALAWRSGPATVSMRWHPASETHRFQTGTADLDEQIRLLDRLHQGCGPGRLDRRGADSRLARAFLNRAHVALKGGNIALARDCLARSIGLSRDVLWTIASDPRLAVQMATLTLAPERARRWFGHTGD